MTKRNLLWAVALYSLALLGIGCGSSEGGIGTTCTQSGATSGQCSAGAVCGKATDSAQSLQCIKSCSAQSDCEASQECNGVEGSSLKGCRTKTSGGGSDGGVDAKK